MTNQAKIDKSQIKSQAPQLPFLVLTATALFLHGASPIDSYTGINGRAQNFAVNIHYPRGVPIKIRLIGEQIAWARGAENSWTASLTLDVGDDEVRVGRSVRNIPSCDRGRERACNLIGKINRIEINGRSSPFSRLAAARRAGSKDRHGALLRDDPLRAVKLPLHTNFGLRK